eukprot:3436726-Pyramimonas_sp.AAC.1
MAARAPSSLKTSTVMSLEIADESVDPGDDGAAGAMSTFSVVPDTQSRSNAVNSRVPASPVS